MNLNDILESLECRAKRLEGDAKATRANSPVTAEVMRIDAAALRAAHSLLRSHAADGNPAGTPGAKVDVSRLPPDLPPPFDSQEEAQRAAGIWPQEAEPATVRVKPSALDEMAAQAASWRDRWVAAGAKPASAGQHVGVTEAEFNAYMCIHGKQRDRIVGASSALEAPYGIDATLAERGSRYGKFEDHSQVSQALKKVVFTKRPRETLAADQVEALEMICHKLGRIVNGDPNYADSWVDIAGYAKLVADRLEGVSR